jgi:hypothetical protein
VELIDPFSVRVVVEQASTDLPALLRRLEEREITVEESSEVPVDWDETFIALVGTEERA